MNKELKQELERKINKNDGKIKEIEARLKQVNKNININVKVLLGVMTPTLVSGVNKACEMGIENRLAMVTTQLGTSAFLIGSALVIYKELLNESAIETYREQEKKMIRLSGEEDIEEKLIKIDETDDKEFLNKYKIDLRMKKILLEEKKHLLKEMHDLYVYPSVEGNTSTNNNVKVLERSKRGKGQRI